MEEDQQQQPTDTDNKFSVLKRKLKSRMRQQQQRRRKNGFSVKVATLKNNRNPNQTLYIYWIDSMIKYCFLRVVSRSVNLSSSSVHHLHCERALRAQNSGLAVALNQQLQENQALVQKVNTLQASSSTYKSSKKWKRKKITFIALNDPNFSLIESRKAQIDAPSRGSTLRLAA